MCWDPDDRANAIKGSKFAIFILGLLCGVSILDALISETRLFTNPKYDDFWADVEAYHLNPDSRPSLEELSRKYDPYAVAIYLRDPKLQAAYLPSEDAAFANMLVYLLSNRVSPISWGFMLLLIYSPVAMGGYFAQRFLTEKLCLSQRAIQARTAYYDAIDQDGLRSMVLAFMITVSLALLNAITKMTPALSERGLTLIELTCGMIFLAYIGGLYMQIVSYIVDAGFLVVGVNPHRWFWDEVAAISIVCPALYLIYKNSWLTIASNVVGGLGAGFFVKWSRARRSQG